MEDNFDGRHLQWNTMFDREQILMETTLDNTSLAAKGALAHRLQRRTAATPAKSNMAARGPQNGRRGLSTARTPTTGTPRACAKR